MATAPTAVNFSPGKQPPLQVVGILALFLMLTIVMTYPMVLRLGDTVPGPEGDNLFFVWEIWWVKHALIDLQVSPFFSSNVFYPNGYELARDELSPANTVVALPLTLIAGPVFSYNSMMLLSFVLSGFGAYLWVARLTGQRSAGLLAGIVFMFLPYRFAHFHGHLNLTSTQWMPLTLIAIDQCFERPCIQRGALIAIFLALLILSAWYYALFALLIVPLYVLCRWRTSARGPLDRSVWKGLLSAVALTLLITLPFILPTTQLAIEEKFAHRIADKELYALNPYDYLIPTLLSPWWGRTVDALFPHQGKFWIEVGVSLSLTALGLSLVGLVARRKGKLPIVVVLVCAFLISLGPTLHWNDQQVRLPVPNALDSALTRAGLWQLLRRSINPSEMDLIRSESSMAIPLPTLAIHLWMPFGNGTRAMDRMAIWTALMLAGLAGMGVVVLRLWLLQQRVARSWQTALWLAVVLMILIESYSVIPYSTLRPRMVDHWLAQQPDDTVVMDFPWWGHIMEYYGTVHQKSAVLGLSGVVYQPAWLQERVMLVNQLPSAETIRALKQWRVSYVLVTPKRIPQWDELKAKLDSATELQMDRILDGVWVYRVSRD